MEKNEEDTLRSFRACRVIMDQLFNEHGGRIFNTAGDSVLAEFQSAVSAVVCANEFQYTVLYKVSKTLGHFLPIWKEHVYGCL